MAVDYLVSLRLWIGYRIVSPRGFEPWVSGCDTLSFSSALGPVEEVAIRSIDPSKYVLEYLRVDLRIVRNAAFELRKLILLRPVIDGSPRLVGILPLFKGGVVKAATELKHQVKFGFLFVVWIESVFVGSNQIPFCTALMRNFR